MADMLATPTQLIIRLNYPDDQEATDRATLAIEDATARIKSATRQKLLAVANETVALPYRGGSKLWLPERPVTAVGTITTTDQYGVVTPRVLNTDYYVIGAEIRWYSWLTTAVIATVTYSHGYASNAVPEDLRDECLRLAALLYENPKGLRSGTETVGSVSAAWMAAGDDMAQFEVSEHIVTAYGLLAVA
jgi:hypothetical protein